MPKRSATPVQKLKRIILMIDKDYQKYKKRSEYTFRITKNKQLPRPAMDEIRNAFGHFVDGCARVFVPPARRGSKTKTRNKGEPLNVFREIYRGRRHLTAAQYYCIKCSVQKRSRGISDLLKSQLADRRADAHYRKRFKEVDAHWRTIESPSEQRRLSITQARREIRIIKRLNAQLDTDLDKLDRLYISIKKRYRNRYVLGTVSRR